MNCQRSVVVDWTATYPASSICKGMIRLFPGLGLAVMGACATTRTCKCSPGDDCWPSETTWAQFNQTVSGKLISTTPLAISCYPGVEYDPAICADVAVDWYTDTFQSTNPIGLDYPLNITCPPIDTSNSTASGKSCSLGTNPWYAVTATKIDDIVATIKFAQDNDLRLVVKSTGHDLLGRNDGYGSLEIWLHYFRNGLTFQSAFESSTGCTASGWAGAAIQLAGAYTWSEGYNFAEENDHVVVGGGTTSVCGTGGWMQGGGHGPASHAFGLGADQVLEADLVLANGSLITVNACQNQELYYAIRGGGPSTYGVVVSTTVKSYPQVNATVQHLSFAAADDSSAEGFLDAIATLYTVVPNLVEAGFAGYSAWQYYGQAPLFDNYTTGYTHAIYMFNRTSADVVTAGQVLIDKINQFNTTLDVAASYLTYPDYWSFFYNVSNSVSPVGIMAAGGSRLLDAPSLSNHTAVRDMVAVLAGQAGDYVVNNIAMVSGGKVWEDASQEHSAILPAWRTAVAHQIVSRAILDPTKWQQIHDDITYNRVAALKKLAPNTGAYMNEADAYDPDWKVDFFGTNYGRLQAIKSRYDPHSLFYCPTCVGSDKWETDSEACLVNESNNTAAFPQRLLANFFMRDTGTVKKARWLRPAKSGSVTTGWCNWAIVASDQYTAAISRTSPE
ncbi:hypothetical protein BX600DRAFT_433794 [Xylariales sp. PMI_506]|nr:hypothetical protein BX600DRAFT_433794 [Xylariales sp. PMI_506]